MKFCEQCFKDKELKAIVGRGKKRGTCDICGRTHVVVCALNSAESDGIRDNIASLLDSYIRCHPEDKSISACNCGRQALDELLASETDVFNLDSPQIKRLLMALFPREKLFATDYVSRVALAKERHDTKEWILPDGDWSRFENSIKFESRFHFALRFNDDNFKIAAARCVTRLRRSASFYRARKSPDGLVFTRGGMFPPPKEKCVSGRLNPSGIQILYLADSPDTATAEMRLKVKEKFCIAQFALKRDLNVLDLTRIDVMSPFAEHMDPFFYLANRATLKNIANEFRRVVDGSNNDLDYLITQYVCDVIKRCGWAGVIYDSTLHPGGRNLALFNIDDAKMIPHSPALYEIECSDYKYRKCD